MTRGIRIEGLTVVRGGRPLVSGVDFSVEPGTVGAIIGTAINAVALYPMILGLIVQPLISLAACLVLIAAGCGYLFVLVRTMHAGLRGSLIVELSAAETQA